MENLSKESLFLILSYVKSNSYQYESCLNLRLVCKAWNEALKNCKPLWSNLGNGPRRIGKDSLHIDGWYKDQCKFNKSGKCYIASHYRRSTLIRREMGYKKYITSRRKKRKRQIQVKINRIERKKTRFIEKCDAELAPLKIQLKQFS